MSLRTEAHKKAGFYLLFGKHSASRLEGLLSGPTLCQHRLRRDAQTNHLRRPDRRRPRSPRLGDLPRHSSRWLEKKLQIVKSLHADGKTTISQICETLRVSRATIYRCLASDKSYVSRMTISRFSHRMEICVCYGVQCDQPRFTA